MCVVYDSKIPNIISNLKLNYKIRLIDNQFPKQQRRKYRLDYEEVLSKNAIFEKKIKL